MPGQVSVVCDDVLHWAENYDGPPFHAAPNEALNLYDRPDREKSSCQGN